MEDDRATDDEDPSADNEDVCVDEDSAGADDDGIPTLDALVEDAWLAALCGEEGPEEAAGLDELSSAEEVGAALLLPPAAPELELVPSAPGPGVPEHAVTPARAPTTANRPIHCLSMLHPPARTPCVS